jgi:hypothetical protein
LKNIGSQNKHFLENDMLTSSPHVALRISRLLICLGLAAGCTKDKAVETPTVDFQPVSSQSERWLPDIPGSVWVSIVLDRIAGDGANDYWAENFRRNGRPLPSLQSPLFPDKAIFANLIYCRFPGEKPVEYINGDWLRKDENGHLLINFKPLSIWYR